MQSYCEEHGTIIGCGWCECDQLRAQLAEREAEVERRKAMQPTDREENPITQSYANRLMVAALDDLPRLRAKLAEHEAEVKRLRKALVVVTSYGLPSFPWYRVAMAALAPPEPQDG